MEDITLFDLTDRPQIELRGGDRQEFLNNFCTGDVTALQPGQGCEAFLTNIKGRILAHLIVSADEEALWIDSVPGSAEAITTHLDKYLITEDAEIINRTGEVGPLCLVGAGAPDWRQNRGGVGEISLWGQQPAVIDGIDVIVRRVGFTEMPAYELVVAHDRREELSAAITAGDAGPGTADLFESLRIAAGFPHYGIDITEENIAQEAGRSRQAISFTKGCYIGQEPIARLDALGHTNRELRRLNLSPGPSPEAGTVVHSSDGNEVGRITSIAPSPAGDRPVALAMLKTSATKPGTELLVGERQAVVVAN